MADNYVQFSEVIFNLTDEEAAWLEKMLGADVESLEGDEWQSFVSEIGFEDRSESPFDYWPGFAWKIYGEDPVWGRHLWIYAECHGDIENIAILVGAFLRKFRPDATFTLTWAETCSKPRVGEFGDGHLTVTAEANGAWNAWSKPGTIIVTVEGGVVQNVENLPPGWGYEVVDHDVERGDDEFVEVNDA